MPDRKFSLSKVPFAFDPRPLDEVSTPRAGLLAVSRALRSLNFSKLIEANFPEEKGDSTLDQKIETLILLQVLGGNTMEEISIFQGDPCLQRGLGYEVADEKKVRAFLESFNGQETGLEAGSASDSKGYTLDRLKMILFGIVSQVRQKLMPEETPEDYYDTREVTLDQGLVDFPNASPDGFKRKGLIVVWQELDQVISGDFLADSSTIKKEIEEVFRNLPKGLFVKRFRGDTLCDQEELIEWLNASERSTEIPSDAYGHYRLNKKDKERQSYYLKKSRFAGITTIAPDRCKIEFCIETKMTEALLAKLSQTEKWQSYKTETDGTQWQWAELEKEESSSADPCEKDLALGEVRTTHHSFRRYVGRRVVRGGKIEKMTAFVTNLEWDGKKLMAWYEMREQTIQGVGRQVLLGRESDASLPAKTQQAWFLISLMAYNVVSLIHRRCMKPETKTDLSRFRAHVVTVVGRMSTFQSKMKLRLCAKQETVEMFQKIWSLFQVKERPTLKR